LPLPLPEDPAHPELQYRVAPVREGL
jgi:hypothetical protein